MRIVGVGVDAIEIARFRRFASNPGAADDVLTAAERQLPIHLQAAAFATKEAILKCLGGSVVTWDLRSIDSVSGELVGAAGARASALGVSTWHLSQSVGRELAVAVAIAEGSTDGP